MFSDPVVGSDFFGRQEILDLLHKRANALKSGYRQNVAIIGHQQLGKTSLLRHFLHTHRDPKILAIYVEIKLQALDVFVEQFIRSLLYQVLSPLQSVDAAEPLSGLKDKAAPVVPKTVARIAEIIQLLKQRHAEEAYSKLFELTSVISAETGRHCIVVLDEFHRLGELGIRNAFSDFGKRIMVQKDTMYLVSSSSFSASKKILAEKLSLLFGNFERVYLEPFDFETSFDFLAKKLEPVRLPESLRYFLVAFTDGHPFFLETIVSRVRERSLAKREEEVSRETVANALLKLLYESQGILHQFFLKWIAPWARPTKARGRHLWVLAAIARGANKLKDIAASAGLGQREASSQIQELVEHELILKTGIFYRFHNKIFKFWLSEVFERKELSLLGASEGAQAFLARIEALIEENERLLRADVTDHVLKLFALFRNDIVEFGEKRRQLPHFTEFLRAPGAAHGGGSARAIIAKGRGRCWVCKITEEKATEKEVLELLDGAAGRREGAATPVLVALNGVDENAKLLAKERKVLTLGLSRLNLLMDLYGRSPIVRAHSRA